MKLINEFLRIMRERSEEEFMKVTLNGDLWVLLIECLPFPISITTSYSSSGGYVIQTEEDLKSYIYMMLHYDEDNDDESV